MSRAFFTLGLSAYIIPWLKAEHSEAVPAHFGVYSADFLESLVSDIIHCLVIKPFAAVGHNLKIFLVVNNYIKRDLMYDRIRGEKDRFRFGSAPFKDKLSALEAVYPYAARSKFKVLAHIRMSGFKNAVQQQVVLFGVY